MTLYLGADYGGPEISKSYTDIKISRLMQFVKKNRTENREKASLNVVFYKSGSICKNEFTGLRTAKFSKKEKMLMVQVAVPEGISDEELDKFLFASLREAAELAKPKFLKAGIEFEIENYCNLVDRVEKEYFSVK